MREFRVHEHESYTHHQVEISNKTPNKYESATVLYLAPWVHEEMRRASLTSAQLPALCVLLVHPRRRPEILARVRDVAQLLLDAQQLVVLGEALRPARRACGAAAGSR